MTSSPWRRWLGRSSRPARPDPRGPKARFRPCLEVLEGRQMLSTFAVVNPNDSGPGSFRQAIMDSNSNPAASGTNLINFNIVGTGVQTIALQSALPTVTAPVVIDGYTQPGSSPNTLAQGSNAVLEVAIDAGDFYRNGSDSAAYAAVSGLTLAADNSTVRGLAINHATGADVYVTGTGDRVEGNFLGTDATGAPTGAGPNQNSDFAFLASGVRLDGAGNTVGGLAPAARNLLSGTQAGVFLSGPTATGNVVEGNLIGTDATGTKAVGNALAGIYADAQAADNTFGGTADGAGNVISGNGGGYPFDLLEYYYGTLDGAGVAIFGAGNSVEGNRIGTDVTGTKALGNAIVVGGGVYLGGAAASDNIIGGAAPGAGNLISGNDRDAVAVSHAGAGNVIEGNRIGTDVTGTAALGNDGAGVDVRATAGTLIGGTAAGAGNLLSGNIYGVNVEDAKSRDTRIEGNRIGTDATGTAALGNRLAGVVDSGTGTTLGGTAAGAGNLISGNGYDFPYVTYEDHVGVYLSGQGGVVEGNRIGTDVTGTKALGNYYSGVLVFGVPNYTIGGAAAGAGNLLSGNGGEGITVESVFNQVTLDGGYLLNGSAANTVVAGNQIGTDATGTAAVGNRGNGVRLVEATGVTVGGTAAGAGNLISGNAGDGVQLYASGSNQIQGNRIGTDATGTAALGNGSHGVLLSYTSGTTIGGTAPGAGNTIAFNHAAGVATALGYSGSITSTDDPILSNSIFGNRLGIDLGDNGPDYYGSPVLTTAGADANGTTVQGTLDNFKPGTTYTLQFFANTTRDPSSYGEGQFLLGSAPVTTDASGHAAFSVTLPPAPAGAPFVSATATDPAGNTSEFSKDFSTARAASGTAVIASPTTSAYGDSVTFTATVTGAPTAGTPTGTVTFTDGSTTLGTAYLYAGGQASLTTSYLAVGPHTITASYSGDDNFLPSSGTAAETVTPPPVTTTTTVSPPSAVADYGQPVTFAATVSANADGAGTPAGTVTFTDYDYAANRYGYVLGTATLDANGQATLTTTDLPLGYHTVYATYGGAAGFYGSSGYTGENVQTVSSYTTTSLAGPGTADVGQPFTLTAAVAPYSSGAGTPTGAVTFYDYYNGTLGTVALANGQASLPTTALTPGYHYYYAAYNPTGSFVASYSNYLYTYVSAAFQPVQNTTTTGVVASPASSAFGQSVTFTATVAPAAGVSGTPTGTVTFGEGNVTLAAVPLDGNGQASFSTSALAAGPHTITATYDGDSNFLGSAGTTDAGVAAAPLAPPDAPSDAAPAPAVRQTTTDPAPATSAVVATAAPAAAAVITVTPSGGRADNHTNEAIAVARLDDPAAAGVAPVAAPVMPSTAGGIDATKGPIGPARGDLFLPGGSDEDVPGPSGDARTVAEMQPTFDASLAFAVESARLRPLGERLAAADGRDESDPSDVKPVAAEAEEGDVSLLLFPAGGKALRVGSSLGEADDSVALVEALARAPVARIIPVTANTGRVAPPPPESPVADAPGSPAGVVPANQARAVDGEGEQPAAATRRAVPVWVTTGLAAVAGVLSGGAWRWWGRRPRRHGAQGSLAHAGVAGRS